MNRISLAVRQSLAQNWAFKPTPLSIKRMVEFGKNPSPELRLRAAQFMRAEVPVRLAHLIRILVSLPHSLPETEPCKILIDRYLGSFELVSSLPLPKDERDVLVSNEALAAIKRRHDTNTYLMSQALSEVKKRLNQQLFCDKKLHQAIDEFYLHRIGIRLLLGQHTSTINKQPNSDLVGIIKENCNPQTIVRDAIDDASFICEHHYGFAPEVDISGQKNLTFMYIPSILHHMLLELIKNSMRAVVETHGAAASKNKINVVVSTGKEDVCIKVSDVGGGIPRSGLPFIWTYLYTTAETPEEPIRHTHVYDNNEVPPLAGFGYGLPISRLYARFFGGDLQVISMDGYGTDAYLHLKRLTATEYPDNKTKTIEAKDVVKSTLAPYYYPPKAPSISL